MKVTLPYQVILVVRGEGSKTPKVVLPHEVPILQHMFGEDAIVPTDHEPHIAEAEFDTEEEYARLQEAYRGDVENPNPTVRVFRSLHEFEAAFTAVAAPAKTVKTAKPAAGNEEKDALLEEAKDLGILANKNWGVAKLKEAIAKAKPKAPAGGEGSSGQD